VSASACRVVVLEKMRMGLGDDVMAQLERFLLLVSKDNVLQGAQNNVQSMQDIAAMDWSAERLTTLGNAIYTMIQGYTDKAISLTSGILSWVTHFTLQARPRCERRGRRCCACWRGAHASLD
jgi:hypothetical protein